jgi:hypothetical protein
MLRKTSSGSIERQAADGTWQPVAPDAPEVEETGVATMIDTLVDEMHNGKAEVPAEPEVALTEDEKLAAHEEFAGVALDPPVMDSVETAPGDFDLEVPGLVSGDTGRSSKGFKTVRERLKENAKKRREPRKVEVGAAAAKVSGPAKVEGTERRQQRRATERMEAGRSAGSTVVGDSAGLKQRYVSRPAPELMSSRPKWVQELFETHFRSEHTLGMRRQFNRMKISRQDYAIGWLTALDKFREQPDLLRAK